MKYPLPRETRIKYRGRDVRVVTVSSGATSTALSYAKALSIVLGKPNAVLFTEDGRARKDYLLSVTLNWDKYQDRCQIIAPLTIGEVPAVVIIDLDTMRNKESRKAVKDLIIFHAPKDAIIFNITTLGKQFDFDLI